MDLRGLVPTDWLESCLTRTDATAVLNVGAMATADVNEGLHLAPGESVTDSNRCRSTTSVGSYPVSTNSRCGKYPSILHTIDILVSCL